MRNYLLLQYKMLSRQLADFGVRPLWAYIGMPVLFVVASVYLFRRTPFAGYLYAAMALSVVAGFSGPGRNSFLKYCFTTRDYYRTRLAENGLVVLPFFLFLLYKNYFLIAVLLLALSGVFAFVQFNFAKQRTIPTPFYKHPFEFIAGCRKNWLALMACYGLANIAIVVNNFNLGIVALLITFLLCLSFYSITEPPFYVWIYSTGPTSFLLKKIKTACLQATLLTLPLAVLLLIFYSGNVLLIGGIYCLGYVYLVAVVCAKYSAFPRQMGLTQTILLMMCVPVPPLLLIVVPYFYNQSLKKIALLLK